MLNNSKERDGSRQCGFKAGKEPERRMCSRESFDPVEFKGKKATPPSSTAVVCSSLPGDWPWDDAVSVVSVDSYVSTSAI